MKGRIAILKVRSKGKPLDEAVSIDDLAASRPGFSARTSRTSSTRRDPRRPAQPQDHRHGGLRGGARADRRRPERKTVISDAEKLIIAYHEGGHAVVQRILPKCDPVQKVTIISRGMALGYTMALPTEDRYLQSKTEFEDKIAGLLGGSVSERMIFGDTTTGSSNDIEKATDLARRMVTEFGMSDRLGRCPSGSATSSCSSAARSASSATTPTRSPSDRRGVRSDRRPANERAQVLEVHRDRLDASRRS